MLKRLLTAHSETEKQVINSITSCIKFMHQHYDIEWFRINQTYLNILQELTKTSKTEPSHVSEQMFSQVAS